MVLSLDKDIVARCFRRSLLTYDDAALVQNKLAKRLVQLLIGLPGSSFRSVLDIGCCTGNLTELLCQEKVVQILYVNDLVSDFEQVILQRMAKHKAVELHTCFGDIEEIVLPNDLSLVLSGVTFQWLSDLPAFLSRLGRQLQKGSYLAFSMFGAGTLKEFSSLTSVKLDYYSDQEVLSFLDPDFIVESYNSYEDHLFFQSVREVLNHIRETGVGGVSEYRWTKKTLRLFEEDYLEKFGSQKGVPVSYLSSCYVARKR